MTKVIKTNLSVKGTEIMDHQSYVDEVGTWENFVIRTKSGWDFPRDSIVENIKYDDFHLSCDIYDRLGKLTKHFAYLDRNSIG